MNNNITLDFDINTTNADAALGVRVSLDGAMLYDSSHVTGTYHFSHELSDDDGDHELSIEMYGKLPQHTKISESGEIVEDSLLLINNIKIDGIDFDKLADHWFEYHHDFNGTQSPTVNKFFNVMGCNGRATLKFTTPIYLWLLEIM
jgi:hypothetical protein